MISYAKFAAKKIAKKFLNYNHSNNIKNQLAHLEYKVIYNHISKLEQRLEELEIERKSLGIISNLANEKKVYLENPISQLATQDQFEEPIYHQWCKRLNDTVKYHRKQWEFIYILQVLEKYHMIVHGKKGIGFGVGNEPIPDYLASQKVECLVSDLETESAIKKGWVHGLEHSRSIKDLQTRFIAGPLEFKKYVSHRFIDMNHIPSSIKHFDFAWSSCALEHLGSINNGLNFIKKSLDCIKPGGVVVHTTEFNISSTEETIDNEDTVLFRKRDIELLQKELSAEGHFIELSFYTGTKPLDRFYDIPPYSENTHLRLKLKNFITTSIGLVIKKRT